MCLAVVLEIMSTINPYTRLGQGISSMCRHREELPVCDTLGYVVCTISF